MTVHLTVSEHLRWQACVDTVSPDDGIAILRQATDRRSHGHLGGSGPQRAGSRDKKLVVYDAALHSLLHEPEGSAVQGEIVAFVESRLTTARTP